MNWKTVSYTLYVFYAALILVHAAINGVSAALFSIIIYFVVLIPLLLARRDDAFFPLSAALALLFIIPLGAMFFGYDMRSSVLGIDKPFHFAGGALLAWFAAILFSKHIKHGFIRALAIVCFAVAVGAWWEVYEWVLLALQNEHMKLTLTDSMLDIVADTLGAMLVAGFVWKKGKR